MRPDAKQLEQFCSRWLKKASCYDIEKLHGCFDKYITLYIVFNAIYNQVGFIIRKRENSDQNGKISGLQMPKQPYKPLPDKESATNYVVQYYGKEKLKVEIEQDHSCRTAIIEIVKLIRDGKFYFRKDYTTGDPDLNQDKKWADDSEKYEPEALLSIIYQVRCNLFHGEKMINDSQKQVLIPLITLLEFITLKVKYKVLEDLKTM